MADVTVTSRAAAVLRRIRSERRGVLTITIDGGCCEGTAPHLYEDYVVPYGSHEIGEAEGVAIFVPPSFKEQYENSAITPIAAEWWLRPVRKAARVGEHSGVAWKLL